MEGVLDDIAFLANSTNRMAVLEAIVESRRHHDEIRERVDASRVTIARIIHELDEKHWIEVEGREYVATPNGTWVYEEFRRLVDEVRAERRLRQPLQWFPSDLLTFDIARLRDAEVVLSTDSDPTAPIRRADEILRAGTRYRIASYQVAAGFFEAVASGVIRGEKALEGVTTPGVYQSIRTNPRMKASFRAVFESDSARFFVVDDVELVLHIVDDHVCIGLTDADDNPRALIVSEDDRIFAWAEETYESYRDAAEPASSP